MKRAVTSVSNATKRTNSSIKKAANDIIDNSKKGKSDRNTILTTNAQSGHGLWCVQTEKKLVKDEKPEEIVRNNIGNTDKNNDFFNEIDKKMIEKLKRQVVDLSVKLDSAMVKASESDYLAQRAENNRQIFQELSDKRAKEIKELEEKIATLEENAVNLNEALAAAKKEISRLQTCCEVEEEKANNYYELYQSLMLEKERRESTMSSEIHALSTQLNLFSRERENLVKVIQNSPNPNELAMNFEKIKTDLEDKIKENEIYIKKLENECAEYKKKLANEEANKNKLNEIVKKKNESIEFMKAEVEKHRNFFEECKKEIKWNQSLALQKENEMKVYVEKIKKLTEENNNLTKKYEKLKLSKGILHEKEEEIVKDKPKPFLFGPETEDL